MKNLFFLATFLFVLLGCKTKQKVATVSELEPTTSEKEEVVEVEHRQLDTMVVSAPPILENLETTSIPETFNLPRYNSSTKRINDLLFTKLDLRFDWEQEKVLGKATLTLKPFFYPTDSLTLDAKGFEFHKVTFEGQSNPLDYKYDGEKISIDLGQSFKREDEYTLYIEYTASPAETGGSAAITSDQGLFFINPKGEDSEKPQQIWTQGETEWNSRWFPTIDKPNERCKQEMFITVEDRFSTLSNGVLVASSKNNDGTRTDHWKMDFDHAPYLFMLAIGEYAVVEEKWNNIPISYYVEPQYKDAAKDIFSNTKEMMDFFSKKLEYPFPWPKYAQIVVRDYVSGAMENTSSSVFGEFVQKSSRDLIDNHNEKIIAHELFHQWFGDLVTCESWANLTMNEGFANYSEYLWLEHKYGKDEADYHLLSEWEGYLEESVSSRHPLIYFSYVNKEDMFDRHSYNKGGSVLHMLRSYVGDEAFWKSLNVYLTKNAYTAVEAHDLRLAFEEVTGEDLNWFFNQWFFDQGHPNLNITYGYNEDEKLATVQIQQLQEADKNPPIFVLPVAIDLYFEDGKVQREKIMVMERDQTFSFAAATKPKLINFDAEKVLLATTQDNKEEEEYVFQFNNAPKFLDRYEALAQLTQSKGEVSQKALNAAMSDPFWGIRVLGLSYSQIEGEEALNKIRRLAVEDPHSQVRAVAFDKLFEVKDEGALSFAKKTLEKEQAYPVIASALDFMFEMDKSEALIEAKKLQNEDNPIILNSISTIFAESESSEFLPFFEKNFSKLNGPFAVSFYENYIRLASTGDLEIAKGAAEKLNSIALKSGEGIWRKFAATKGLNDMQMDFSKKAEDESDPDAKLALKEYATTLKEFLSKIKATETDNQLIGIYNQMF